MVKKYIKKHISESNSFNRDLEFIFLSQEHNTNGKAGNDHKIFLFYNVKNDSQQCLRKSGKLDCHEHRQSKIQWSSLHMSLLHYRNKANDTGQHH